MLHVPETQNPVKKENTVRQAPLFSDSEMKQFAADIEKKIKGLSNEDIEQIVGKSSQR